VQCSVWGFCLCRGQPPERPGWRGVEIGEHACVGEQEGGGEPASVPCADSTGRDGDGIGWKSAVESPPLPALDASVCLPSCGHDLPARSANENQRTMQRSGKEKQVLLGVVSERSSGRLVDRPSQEAPHWQMINQQLACLSQREGQLKLTGLPDEIERVN
jgi:hypothetical protein